MIEVAVFVFVFVSIYVGGLRAFARLDQIKADSAEQRRLNVVARAHHYSGPLYNRHGNEICE